MLYQLYSFKTFTKFHATIQTTYTGNSTACRITSSNTSTTHTIVISHFKVHTLYHIITDITLYFPKPFSGHSVHSSQYIPHSLGFPLIGVISRELSNLYDQFLVSPFKLDITRFFKGVKVVLYSTIQR